MRRWNWILGTTMLLALTACQSDLPESVVLAYVDLPETVDFNFHIQPILSDRCYSCHGPDEVSRKAGLRLDLQEAAFAKLESGKVAIRKGKPWKSELVNRILHDDPEIVMPTPESNLSLTDEEKAYLIKWIEQGAEWKEHWAFEAPTLPEIPEIEDKNMRVNNSIDNFIIAQ
ncbi:MAG: c-type cytochrome domain-containing protein, partial [Bacteroidota bacterium]